MPQHVVLDPRPSDTYYAVAVCGLLGLTACRGLPPTIAPAGLEPLPESVVETWVSRFALHGPVRYDIRWRLINDRGAAAGRAAVRLVPPDSMRFDFRGPFGRSGAAMVVGDSALWIQPESSMQGVVRVAPLFWAALGVPLKPPAGSETFGTNAQDRRAWRYLVGQDTFNFVDRTAEGTPPRLLAELRRAGKPVGITNTRFSAETGVPVEARMDFPLDASRFSFTVEAVDTLETPDPAIWERP